MTCCETCLYEPAKMCTSGKWDLLLQQYLWIWSPYVAFSRKTHTRTHTHSNNRERVMQFLCFTDLFKENLSLNQARVDWISTCGNAGLYSAILGGLFYNRCGPRWTAFIGAILIAIGFGGMYECAKEDATCNENSVGFLNFIAQHGSGWIASCTLLSLTHLTPRITYNILERRYDGNERQELFQS